MKYLDSIYGEFELPAIIEELIATGVFQRLKRIHQGGAIMLVNPSINHTRFDHSIGVMLLINIVEGDLSEQIAGLLHDISHTAFSHLVDYVFELEEEDYHEKRYVEVLEDAEIQAVLAKYGFDIDAFKELEAYKILEYPLPNLSADRIDYTLRDLYQLGQIPLEEIQWFIQGLQVVGERIVLTEKKYAEWFQAKYRYLTSQYFESTENKEVHLVMKLLLKDALQKGDITEADFFEDDFYLIDKLGGEACLKGTIQNKRGTIEDSIKMKTRTVDPEILVGDEIVRLSDLSGAAMSYAHV
jgi:HD superfamily phosphohydrolase